MFSVWMLHCPSLPSIKLHYKLNINQIMRLYNQATLEHFSKRSNWLTTQRCAGLSKNLMQTTIKVLTRADGRWIKSP